MVLVVPQVVLKLFEDVKNGQEGAMMALQQKIMDDELDGREYSLNRHMVFSPRGVCITCLSYFPISMRGL